MGSNLVVIKSVINKRTIFLVRVNPYGAVLSRDSTDHLDGK